MTSLLIDDAQLDPRAANPWRLRADSTFISNLFVKRNHWYSIIWLKSDLLVNSFSVSKHDVDSLALSQIND